MKKKILVTTHTLNIGGVERSFIGLLENIDYNLYDVDIFVYQHHGELFQSIPKQVNLLPEINAYALLLKPFKYSLFSMNLGVLFAKLFGNIISKLKRRFLVIDSNKVDSISHATIYSIANYFMPKISTIEYDAVLAFLHPNFFESTKVKAKKKIGWVHTDYSFLNFDKKLEFKMWSNLDHIFGVSEASASTFTKIYPEFKHKVSVFENVLSSKFIIDESTVYEATEIESAAVKFKFLSIGRFSYAKNFDNIPEIAYYLKKLGLSFNWFIIGYGSTIEHNKIIEAIKLYGVEKEVVILGKKNNPYPYIKSCDIYIQPSRFEGKAVTVREAQILGKPVVITDFESSKSQLKNNYDGIIVPMENEKCANGIYSFVTDELLVNEIISNVLSNDYSNVEEIKKLDYFI